MPFCPYCDFQIPLTDAKFCPNCGRAIESGVLPARNSASRPPSQFAQQSVETGGANGNRWMLLPGEHIEWEKDFKVGLVHRHVERAYVITNLRVVAIDIVNDVVVVSLPLREADLVVMDRHSSSTSTGIGSYHSGVGTSVRSGTSTTVGTLVFITNGTERIRIGGIGDPDGIRSLFPSLKHSRP
jgi:hypothetical protein